MGSKVSIRFLAVNTAWPWRGGGRLPFLLVLPVAWLIGCGPIVSVAPFAERPNSVKPGSLLGPFEGQVVDADTQQPLAEAVVSCSWAFDRGVGVPAPDASRTTSTRTDVDGRYHVPALGRFPQGLSARLARLSFVVYKKDYVAYRQDHVFPRERARFDFAQLNHLVKLSRWSPELSHAEHLVFLGGGDGLEAPSSWEVLPAAAELDRGPLPTRPVAQPTPTSQPSGGGLDASVLLSSDQVRAVTGYTGQFTTGRLPGDHSAAHDSFHLRAVDRPERYDVAVRVWRPGVAKLTAKYEEMLNALPGSKQNDEIGDRSFTVKQGEILGLGFLDRGSEAVVLLTCGRGQCTKESQLLELGKQVEQNLAKLPPGEGASTSTPAPEPESEVEP